MNVVKCPRFRLDAKSFRLLRHSILKRDRWRCQSCGSRAGLEVHHITPRSKLGHDAAENLITLCWHCHRQIHSNNLDDDMSITVPDKNDISIK
jgi:5-methylcytosine-specific restriction endonuclease McrA